jgi:hypothetical protein
MLWFDARLVFDFTYGGSDSPECDPHWPGGLRGRQLYDGLVMELRKWCSHIYCWHIEHAEDAEQSMVAYVRFAEHYARATTRLQKMFAYLQRHWLPRMTEEGFGGDPYQWQYVDIYTTVCRIWCDAVLRRCIARLGAAVHPTPQHGAAMFESVHTLFDGGEGGDDSEDDDEGAVQKRKRCDTLDALHGELDARVVRYAPEPCSWFDPEGPPTRVDFRRCYTDTRATVLTLLLIGHRRANGASEAVDSVVLATQFNAVHVWILIASFLPL